MELRHTPTRARSDLLTQSLAGVRSWLIREWELRVSSPKLHVALVDQYKQGAKAVQLFTNRQPNEPLALPYALIVPTQIAPRNEGFNKMALQKIGLRTGYVNGGRQERREKLTPINAGLGVRFTTNDINEALMFGQIWAEHSPFAVFDVLQKSTGYRFKIILEPDPSVDIPQDREEHEELHCFTTLIVKTFVGTTEVNKIITKTSTGIVAGDGPDDPDAYEIHRIDHNGFKLANPALLEEKLGLKE